MQCYREMLAVILSYMTSVGCSVMSKWEMGRLLTTHDVFRSHIEHACLKGLMLHVVAAKI